MGRNIEIIKCKDQEDGEFVYYKYFYEVLDKNTPKTLKTVSGKIKIDKKAGCLYVEELALGDSGCQADAAFTAVIRYWVKNGGEYPDKAYFQS